MIDHKWEAHNTVLHDIFTQRGIPTRDLFTFQANKKCAMYCSRGALGYRSPGNALLSWPDQFNFPPLLLLPQVLCKIWQDRATVILISPLWPRQFWFSNLLCLSPWPLITLPILPELLVQCNSRIKHPKSMTSLPQGVVFGWAERACSSAV